MNMQAIPYSMARDPEALSRLVGEDVVMAVVDQPDGSIFYSTDPELERTADIQTVFPSNLTYRKYRSSTECLIAEMVEDGTSYLVSMTPLHIEGRKLGHLYLRLACKMRNSARVTFRGLSVWDLGACILLISLASALLVRLDGRCLG